MAAAEDLALGCAGGLEVAEGLEAAGLTGLAHIGGAHQAAIAQGSGVLKKVQHVLLPPV